MKHYAILFTRKSGRVVKMLEQGFGDAMLKLWAMNNTSSSRDCIIFDEQGIVTAYFEGKKDDLPNICKDVVGTSVEDFGFDLKEIL